MGSIHAVRTVVLGPRPQELEALIERRRATGADLYDEVWDGDYVMAPAPRPDHGIVDDELAAILRPLARAAGLIGSGPLNLGERNDYRVPDRGLHRRVPTTTFVPTAALVVEIVSPGDETWRKLDFYAAHGVDELVIADPDTRRLTWLGRTADGYVEVERSALLGIDVAEVTAKIAWPSSGDEGA
jgi:Uma2 family endonuclease